MGCSPDGAQTTGDIDPHLPTTRRDHFRKLEKVRPAYSRAFLAMVEAEFLVRAAAQLDKVDAFAFENRTQRRRVAGLQSPIRELDAVDLDAYDESRRRYRPADRADDIAGRAGAVFDPGVSPVLLVSAVRDGRQQLREEIAMRVGELHPIKPGGLDVRCSVGEIRDDLLELCEGRGLRFREAFAGDVVVALDVARAGGIKLKPDAHVASGVTQLA